MNDHASLARTVVVGVESLPLPVTDSYSRVGLQRKATKHRRLNKPMNDGGRLRKSEFPCHSTLRRGTGAYQKRRFAGPFGENDDDITVEGLSTCFRHEERRLCSHNLVPRKPKHVNTVQRA